MTSEDVKFSMERVRIPRTRLPWQSVWTGVVASIETPNPYTVKYFLKYPDPAFLAKLAPWRPGPIVCKKAVEKFGKDYGQKPEFTVGSGPFEVTEYVPSKKSFSRGTPGTIGPRPKVDAIELYVIGDEGTAVLPFKRRVGYVLSPGSGQHTDCSKRPESERLQGPGSHDERLYSLQSRSSHPQRHKGAAGDGPCP